MKSIWLRIIHGFSGILALLWNQIASSLFFISSFPENQISQLTWGLDAALGDRPGATRF
jgi:hypothetical protein